MLQHTTEIKTTGHVNDNSEELKQLSLSKYTLDRYDDGFAVLLKHPGEEEQLLIPQHELESLAKEGDILQVEQTEAGNSYKVLREETNDVRNEIEDLIKKLKNS